MEKVSQREPFRIVIADDHIPFRSSLKRILCEGGRCEVVAEVNDGIKLLDLLRQMALDRVAPHLAIVDVSMPTRWGIDAIHQIKESYPNMKVLALSMHEDKEYLDHALIAGAEGYLLKEEANTGLFPAIEMIRNGGTYISPHFSEKL